jgi:hypothetical protein
MGRGALIITLLAASAAQADPLEYQTSDGQHYLFVAGKGGGMLYLQSDTQDWHELLPDCSALRADGTLGTWEWANGGWRVVYGEKVAVGFPRQEAPMGAPPECLAE